MTVFFQDDSESSDDKPRSDSFDPDLSFEQIQDMEFKGYELLTLRRHYSTEVRNMSDMLGNDLTKIDFIELDDFLGIDESKAMTLALTRIKHAKYDDNLVSVGDN